MFLWVDPLRPGRALLYLSTPTSRTDRPNLIVTDISGAREGVFTEVVRWNGNDEFTAEEREGRDVRLHSMGVSANGTRTYLAYLGGGFLVLDWVTWRTPSRIRRSASSPRRARALAGRTRLSTRP
jgi:hypothetical protein